MTTLSTCLSFGFTTALGIEIVAQASQALSKLMYFLQKVQTKALLLLH